jgi:hypothetical protein
MPAPDDVDTIYVFTFNATASAITLRQHQIGNPNIKQLCVPFGIDRKGSALTNSWLRTALQCFQ